MGGHRLWVEFGCPFFLRFLRSVFALSDASRSVAEFVRVVESL
jgi:hypothetical protein